MNKSKKHLHDPAFTIIELLVVIVVIAILAVITIVSYTGITKQAVASSLQSDLTNASTQLKMFQVDNGNYPTTMSTDCNASPTTTTNLCIKLSNGNSYIGYSASNSSSTRTFLLIASNSHTVSSSSLTYKITDSAAPTQLANTMQPNVTPGAILELHAAKANNGLTQGINSPLTTTWKGTSGNNNDGTLTNFAGETPWSADHLTVTSAGTRDTVTTGVTGFDSARTWEAWARLPDGFVSNVYLFSHGNPSAAPSFSVTTGWAGVQCPLLILAGNNYRYWSTVALGSDLHHFVMTVPGNSLDDISSSTLYIDGVLQVVNNSSSRSQLRCWLNLVERYIG